MESLSSYTISDVSADQVKEFVELTELAGVPTTFEITKIILQMLSSGIQPEVIYHLCVDMRNERKRLRHKKEKKSNSNVAKSVEYE
ncbi:hypothetical protein V9T40_006153 [Parthenolecanium corni]|uniref:Uncharacterized protein n=1 Tax=Parthenolecanium corni TaxID=536013 RepID=A0AAN9YBC0_9HEMI